MAISSLPDDMSGAEEIEDDDEPFEEKMQRLAGDPGEEQFSEGTKLESRFAKTYQG